MTDRPVRIMLVDDHAVFRRALGGVLSEVPGFEVVAEASDGGEAITRALEVKPDVIMMDLRMPGVNGLEATTRIKEALPEVKILMLTVSDGANDLFAAIKAGATGYLLKDTDIDALLSAVRSVAEGNVFITPGLVAKLPHVQGTLDRMLRGDRDELLSDDEKKVVRLLAAGASNREIAEVLSLDEAAVRGLLHNLFTRLNVKNRTEAKAIITAFRMDKK